MNSTVALNSSADYRDNTFPTAPVLIEPFAEVIPGCELVGAELAWSGRTLRLLAF
jgi:hypothetical protein